MHLLCLSSALSLVVARSFYVVVAVAVAKWMEEILQVCDVSLLLLDGIINAGVVACYPVCDPVGRKSRRVPLNRWKTWGRRSFGPRYKAAELYVRFNVLNHERIRLRPQNPDNDYTEYNIRDRQILSLSGIPWIDSKAPAWFIHQWPDPVFRHNNLNSSPRLLLLLCYSAHPNCD